jgi:hypothetical protein
VDSPLFSDAERAAFGLADALNVLPAAPLDEDAFADAANHFPDRFLAELVGVITAINAWNCVMLPRGIAVAGHSCPGQTDRPIGRSVGRSAREVPGVVTPVNPRRCA